MNFPFRARVLLDLSWGRQRQMEPSQRFSSETIRLLRSRGIRELARNGELASLLRSRTLRFSVDVDCRKDGPLGVNLVADQSRKICGRDELNLWKPRSSSAPDKTR
jgi:hypothetical protein